MAELEGALRGAGTDITALSYVRTLKRNNLIGSQKGAWKFRRVCMIKSILSAQLRCANQCNKQFPSAWSLKQNPHCVFTSNLTGSHGALASLSSNPTQTGQAALFDWADKTLGQGLSHVTKSVKTLLSGEREGREGGVNNDERLCCKEWVPADLLISACSICL